MSPLIYASNNLLINQTTRQQSNKVSFRSLQESDQDQLLAFEAYFTNNQIYGVNENERKVGGFQSTFTVED